MILFDLFSDILDFAQALIIDIPLNNDLSYLYVIINTVLSLLMTLFTLVALPFVWATPSFSELVLLMLVGLVGGVAQVMLTEAYASAQVSALGPYSYTSILWSVAIGWVVFADAPGWSTIAGAALIVASGLYILHRELKRAAQRRKQ